MTPGPWIKPGTHRWEASALTTAPSLLPCNVSGKLEYGKLEHAANIKYLKLTYPIRIPKKNERLLLLI